MGRMCICNIILVPEVFFHHGEMRQEREKEAARENLWLRVMQTSLSRYDRCHENRLTNNQ